MKTLNAIVNGTKTETVAVSKTNKDSAILANVTLTLRGIPLILTGNVNFTLPEGTHLPVKLMEFTEYNSVDLAYLAKWLTDEKSWSEMSKEERVAVKATLSGFNCVGVLPNDEVIDLHINSKQTVIQIIAKSQNLIGSTKMAKSTKDKAWLRINKQVEKLSLNNIKTKVAHMVQQLLNLVKEKDSFNGVIQSTYQLDK